jgi:hypothetical protein
MTQSISEKVGAGIDAMKATPQQQHEWLLKLVGEWRYEADVPAQAGLSPSKVVGTETVRSLGDLWILAEGQGEMPGGGPATTLMTLGYDPAKGRFVGTWIGSMMAYLWVYDGELDPAGKLLTLKTEGPSMDGDGTMAQYLDSIEFKGDDHRVLTARVKGKDGQWKQFMTMDYRRERR